MSIAILNELVKNVDDFQLNKILIKAFKIGGIESDARLMTDTALILQNSQVRIEFIDLPSLKTTSIEALKGEIMEYDINMLYYIQQLKNPKVQEVISKACKFDLEILRTCEVKLFKINSILKETAAIQPVPLSKESEFHFAYAELLEQLNFTENSLKTMIKSDSDQILNHLRKADSVLSEKIDEITKIESERSKSSTHRTKVSKDREVVNKWKEELKKKQEVAKTEIRTMNKFERYRRKAKISENKERVDFREAKLELKKIESIMKAENVKLIKFAKEQVLQSIRDTVRIVGKSDKSRIVGHTENWTNKLKSEDKSSRPLLLTTYNNEQLFQNPTFSLLHKLHNKGLTKTSYSGQLLKDMSK